MEKLIKSKKEKAFSLIGFILLFILLTLLLSAAVKPDSPMDCTDKRKFEALRVFDEPNNTLDALFFGTRQRRVLRHKSYGNVCKVRFYFVRLLVCLANAVGNYRIFERNPEKTKTERRRCGR